MATPLKQSTAFTDRLGPFVDSTDGVTAETALTIGQADIQISKDGGAFAQTSASSPTTTHDADGWYQLPLTTTDTNTLGPLTVQVAMAGALPVWKHYVVYPANVYDSMVDGSDNLEVDPVLLDGDATALDNLVNQVTNLETGTAQAGAAGSLTLRSGASATDDFHNGDVVWIYGGTGAGQSPRVITDYVGSTKVASVSPNWTTTPDGTSTYIVFPSPPATEAVGSLPRVDVRAVSGQTASATATVDFDDIAAILLDTNELQTDDVPGLISALNDPTAAAIADAVWDEVITGAEHNVNNSAAKFLREASEAIGITGTAQAGAATTITLATGASATDDIYNFEAITIIEGTGAGQARLITDYNGTTKVATVNRAWTTNPSTDSVYSIAGADAVVEAVNDQTVEATAPVDFDDLASILANHPSNFSSLVISGGGIANANMEQINGVTVTGDGSGTPFGV